MHFNPMAAVRMWPAFIGRERMQGDFTEARMWCRGGPAQLQGALRFGGGLDGRVLKGWKDAEALKSGRTQLCHFAERQLKQSCLGMELLE